MNADTAHKQLKYVDEDLAQDLAASTFSMQEIAERHGISLRQTYELAAGTSRPSIRARVDELHEAGKQAGTRFAKSKAFWAVRRLAELAEQDVDRGAALRATTQLLEMGGMLTETGGDDKKTIEVIFSAAKDKADPLARRLTGVVNGNN